MTDIRTVPVNLSARSYEILIADSMDGIGLAATRWLRDRFGESTPLKALMVVDRNVKAPHAANVARSLSACDWQTEQFELEPGESSKSLATISAIYEQLVAMRADRQTVVIAIGGGVTGDAAGFAAASWMRGVPFVQVPTTLLAHVDSSVGGKTGVNLPQGKNLIGAFHQPLGVYIDTTTLSTLPPREYRSGLTEVVKYGVILDAEFFGYLEDNVDGLNARAPDVMRHIIARSCELKAHVVENDEFERTGLRAVLNYGHTFAHAFEARSSYSELLHGEAVSIGMVCGSCLAERLGRIPADVTARQVRLLQSLQLPVGIPDSLSGRVDDLIATMLLDKKTVNGQLRFILPTKMGHVETVRGIDEADVRRILE